MLEVGGLSACGLNREMLCKRRDANEKGGTGILTWGVELVFSSSLLSAFWLVGNLREGLEY